MQVFIKWSGSIADSFLAIEQTSTNFFGKYIGSAIVLITVLCEVCQEMSKELIEILSILLSILLSGAVFTNESYAEVNILLKFIGNDYRLKVSEVLAFSANCIMVRQGLAEAGFINVVPIICILTRGISHRNEPLKWRNDLLKIPNYESLKDSHLRDLRYFLFIIS